MKARTYTQAKNEGYFVTNILENNRNSDVRIDMQQRFFKSDKPSILSYWMTYRGAKRLGIL
jgi:hypothetical protein